MREGRLAIRLKDIAAELGVSTITVSKVLRDKPDVGEETRRRVLERVKALGYRPNLLAKGLASGRSLTIGVVVPDLVHTFFAELAKGLKVGLRQRGYQLILASAEEDPALEAEEIENLLSRGVDGLIVASCQVLPEKLDALSRAGVPCVLLDRAFAELPFHFVGSDDVAAGCVAVRHLVALGRRRIAHIGNPDMCTGRDRFEGYRKSLGEAGLPYCEELVVQRTRMEEQGDRVGFEAMKELLRLAKRPDAVFCYNDLSAVGAIKCALAEGLRVPEDVAVMGCGNLRLATYLEVPLSSMDQRTEELGEEAARLVVALLAGEEMSRREIRIEPRLIARASTGAAEYVS